MCFVLLDNQITLSYFVFFWRPFELYSLAQIYGAACCIVDDLMNAWILNLLEKCVNTNNSCQICKNKQGIANLHPQYYKTWECFLSSQCAIYSNNAAQTLQHISNHTANNLWKFVCIQLDNWCPICLDMTSEFYPMIYLLVCLG